MKDYQSLANDYIAQLSSLYGATESKSLFLMVYSFLTQKKALQFSLTSNDRVDEPIVLQFASILNELKTGKPIQHILGEADFFGFRFKVNEHTLIPRPETEELVDWIINDQQHSGPITILDIGTGSGCIALSLARHLPQALVYAIDISAEALAVARENAARLAVDVRFVQADILEWEYILQTDQRFDIIVSNPPYITPKEQDAMHSNVLRFEPHSALFVEEHAPLLFYDAISSLGKHHLHPSGTLYFEINQYLGVETKALLHKKGYAQLQLRQDLHGADRMLKGKLFV